MNNLTLIQFLNIFQKSYFSVPPQTRFLCTMSAVQTRKSWTAEKDALSLAKEHVSESNIDVSGLARVKTTVTMMMTIISVVLVALVVMLE